MVFDAPYGISKSRHGSGSRRDQQTHKHGSKTHASMLNDAWSEKHGGRKDPPLHNRKDRYGIPIKRRDPRKFMANPHRAEFRGAVEERTLYAERSLPPGVLGGVGT